MIPMSCPNCGQRGNVPPDRLGTRMSCRKCQAVFHMDRTGHIMLGEPVDEDGRKTKARKPKRPKGQRESIDLGFVQTFKTAPMPAKIGLGAGVLLLPFLFGFRISLGEPVPANLEGRATYAANAFADNAVSRLQGLASSGTSEDVAAWFEKARPQFKFEGPQSGDANRVIVVPLVMDSGETESNVHTTLIAPAPELSEKSESPKPKNTIGYNSDGNFELPMYFVKEGSDWKLDGKKCLENASAD